MNFNINKSCYYSQLENRYVLNPNNPQYKSIVGDSFIVKRDKNSQFISASGVSSGGKQNGQILTRSNAGTMRQQWKRFSIAKDVKKHDIRIPFKARRKSKLIANDGAANDDFGFSVAIDGNIAVVGAVDADIGGNSNQGAAYVFTKTSGGWTQTQKLIAADGAAGDFFGWSVAIGGGVIVVGADEANVDGNNEQGAAYVFTKIGGVWTQTAKLTAADGVAGDHFGESVAISGGVIVIGAYLADIDGNNEQGAAYVFTKIGGVWTQTAKLTADDGVAGEHFGESVAIAGGVIVIGAYLADIGGNIGQGAAYVFAKTSGGWTQTAKLTAADGAAGDNLGESVAIAGGVIVVGADKADIDGNSNQGAAYVFTKTSGGWSQTQKLIATDGTAGDTFGFSVVITGGLIVVSTPLSDIGGNIGQGAAYVFTCKNGVWNQISKITANDGAAGDRFGYSVAITGNRAVVGANLANVGGNIQQGVAYIIDDLLYGSNLQVRLN